MYFYSTMLNAGPIQCNYFTRRNNDKSNHIQILFLLLLFILGKHSVYEIYVENVYEMYMKCRIEQIVTK